MAKQYIITKTSPYTGKEYKTRPLTIEEAVDYYSYTLECGYSWQHEKGNKKINLHPKTMKSLISNLNNATNNSARNGCGDYFVAEDFVSTQVEKQVVEQYNNEGCLL
jgi:hypothetical protein